MSRAKAVFTPPAELVVVARSSYPTQTGLLHETRCSSPVLCFFTVICSERTALGGIDGDGAQKILQRLLVGGAADVQLL